MRTPLVTLFHETIAFCFNSALEGMGATVRDVIYDFLEKRGIIRNEVSLRFDEVVKILMDTFGSSARIIIYKTVVELHREYSLRADFTYQDSFHDRITLLKDRVVGDHLVPRHAQRPDDYFENPRPISMGQSATASQVKTTR